MSSSNGRAGVVADAVNGAVSEIARAGAAAIGEQVEMFALPTRFAGERELEQIAGAARSRGPGRPPGAENRATVAFREYLLRRGAHPLENLMRWSLHSPATLARELDCSPLEAFRELRAVWSELAPYFASKVAPSDDEGRAVPQFMMVFPGSSAPGVAPGGPPWAYLEAEQNQRVTPDPPSVSHGAVSHGQAK